MPYDIKATGGRFEIIEWLKTNVGEYSSGKHLYSATGMGWELLPLGIDYNRKFFNEPTQWCIRIWDKDKAFLARLRWG